MLGSCKVHSCYIGYLNRTCEPESNKEPDIDNISLSKICELKANNILSPNICNPETNNISLSNIFELEANNILLFNILSNIYKLEADNTSLPNIYEPGADNVSSLG
ncbi:28644_t:CDS:1 [Dentiscutata erythropus]|uniref:28644_t:CDS:1 n=1 Tax=Dentiscutata erythropus TaxID=1348616 RepID=A0A9N9AXY1_9GLOM|nr:28644_t:CDS:1 [Dentiscutata erythropus]